MKNKKYILGENVKNITILPDFIVKLIGRIDAHRGEEVAVTHVERFFERCTALENRECLRSEEFLKKARIEGASILNIINSTKNRLPDTYVKTAKEKAPWEELEERKRMEAHAQTKNNIREAKNRLVVLNEEIVNGTSILDQRIERIRKKAAAKIDTYIKGVRTGGIASFNPNVSFSDTAVKRYYEKHKLDKNIAAAAETANDKEV